MARKVVPEKDQDSKFWKPDEIGDKIDGEYLGAEDGKYGLEHRLKTSDGEKVLPAHKVLQSKMEDIHVGWYVWVELVGKQSNKKGNDTKLYKVEYDDEYKSQATLDENKTGKSNYDIIVERVDIAKQNGISVSDGVLESIASTVLESKDMATIQDALQKIKGAGRITKKQGCWVKT